MSTKWCVGFFFFLLDHELLIKVSKASVQKPDLLLIFANNSRSKQNKKNPTHAFVDIGNKETRTKFQQKIQNCKVVGAGQIFQIFRQNTCFLENNRALSDFFVWDFALINQYHQIIIKSVHKRLFHFNHASDLNIVICNSCLEIFLTNSSTVISSGRFLCDRRVLIALIIDVFRVSMVILLDFISSNINYDSQLLYIKCNKRNNKILILNEL